ncbi:hypothetical protein [Conexibacter woesei]|uniref:hypothetical protein n=1 Tax=Conexibacter woesei TaxID=191495 RepID=UPI000400EF1B|nr:hypothetical protein [Conexibacter woesei]
MSPLPARILTIGAACAATAFAASGCGAGDSARSAASSARNALDPVAQAADVTGAQKGGIAMTIRGEVGAAGQTVPLSGSGTFDRAGKLGQMSMTTSAAGQTIKMDEIIKGHTVYVTSDAFKGKLPGGKDWMKLDLDAAAKSQGIDLSSLTGGGGASQDPSQVLDYLKGAGTSTKVGDETINGVPTTHYHAVIDLKKAAAKGGADAEKAVSQLEKLSGVSSLPLDVWIDKDHLVRRESMKYDMTVQGQRASMSMTVDMTKYGVDVTAKPPADSDTIDASKLLDSLGRSGSPDTSTGSGSISG